MFISTEEYVNLVNSGYIPVSCRALSPEFPDELCVYEALGIDKDDEDKALLTIKFVYPKPRRVLIRFLRLDISLAIEENGFKFLPKLVSKKEKMGKLGYLPSTKSTQNKERAAAILGYGAYLHPDHEVSVEI